MYARLHGGIAVYSSGNLAVSDRATFLQSSGVSLIHSNVVGIESLLFQFDRQNKIEVPYLVTLHGSYDGMNTDRAEVIRTKIFLPKRIFRRAPLRKSIMRCLPMNGLITRQDRNSGFQKTPLSLLLLRGALRAKVGMS